MKKCPNCGKAVPDNFPNCPSCGAQVSPSNVKVTVSTTVEPGANAGQGEVVTTTNMVPFKKHVRKFKGFHCFSAYFWKLLYIVGVIAMLGAVVMVPFIPKEGETEFNAFAIDFEFTGLTSIFTIVKDQIDIFLADTTKFDALVKIIAVILFALPLVPALIWAVVKLIRCLILMIFSGAKKKTVVIESLAKTEHKEYDYGMLNADKLYPFALFTVIWIILLCVAKPAINEFLPDIYDTVDGFTKILDPFTAADIHYFINFGSVCIVAAILLSTLLGIFFFIVRGIVRRKVRKHFGLIQKK